MCSVKDGYLNCLAEDDRDRVLTHMNGYFDGRGVYGHDAGHGSGGGSGEISGSGFKSGAANGHGCGGGSGSCTLANGLICSEGWGGDVHN